MLAYSSFLISFGQMETDAISKRQSRRQSRRAALEGSLEDDGTITVDIDSQKDDVDINQAVGSSPDELLVIHRTKGPAGKRRPSRTPHDVMSIKDPNAGDDPVIMDVETIPSSFVTAEAAKEEQAIVVPPMPEKPLADSVKCVKCGNSTEINEYAKHVISCFAETAICPYCKTEVQFWTLSEHVKGCNKAPNFAVTPFLLPSASTTNSFLTSVFAGEAPVKPSERAGKSDQEDEAEKSHHRHRHHNKGEKDSDKEKDKDKSKKKDIVSKRGRLLKGKLRSAVFARISKLKPEDVPAEQLMRLLPMKRGFLWIRMNFGPFRLWTRRYMKLLDNQLYYDVDEDGIFSALPKDHGVIDLSDAVIEIAHAEVKRENAIRIQTYRGKILFIAAESLLEMEDWMNVLVHAPIQFVDKALTAIRKSHESARFVSAAVAKLLVNYEVKVYLAESSGTEVLGALLKSHDPDVVQNACLALASWLEGWEPLNATNLTILNSIFDFARSSLSTLKTKDALAALYISVCWSLLGEYEKIESISEEGAALFASSLASDNPYVRGHALRILRRLSAGRSNKFTIARFENVQMLFRILDSPALPYTDRVEALYGVANISDSPDVCDMICDNGEFLEILLDVCEGAELPDDRDLERELKRAVSRTFRQLLRSRDNSIVLVEEQIPSALVVLCENHDTEVRTHAVRGVSSLAAAGFGDELASVGGLDSLMYAVTVFRKPYGVHRDIQRNVCRAIFHIVRTVHHLLNTADNRVLCHDLREFVVKLRNRTNLVEVQVMCSAILLLLGGEMDDFIFQNNMTNCVRKLKYLVYGGNKKKELAGAYAVALLNEIVIGHRAYFSEAGGFEMLNSLAASSNEAASSVAANAITSLLSNEMANASKLLYDGGKEAIENLVRSKASNLQIAGFKIVAAAAAYDFGREMVLVSDRCFLWIDAIVADPEAQIALAQAIAALVVHGGATSAVRMFDGGLMNAMNRLLIDCSYQRVSSRSLETLGLLVNLEQEIEEDEREVMEDMFVLASSTPVVDKIEKHLQHAEDAFVFRAVYALEATARHGRNMEEFNRETLIKSVLTLLYVEDSDLVLLLLRFLELSASHLGLKERLRQLEIDVTLPKLMLHGDPRIRLLVEEIAPLFDIVLEKQEKAPEEERERARPRSGRTSRNGTRRLLGRKPRSHKDASAADDQPFDVATMEQDANGEEEEAVVGAASVENEGAFEQSPQSTMVEDVALTEEAGEVDKEEGQAVTAGEESEKHDERNHSDATEVEGERRPGVETTIARAPGIESIASASISVSSLKSRPPSGNGKLRDSGRERSNSENKPPHTPRGTTPDMPPPSRGSKRRSVAYPSSASGNDSSVAITEEEQGEIRRAERSERRNRRRERAGTLRM